jgi:hypothetical protein
MKSGGILPPAAIFGPDTPPLNVLGGYKFPGAPDIAEVLPRRVEPPSISDAAVAALLAGRDDPLEIPEFLRRESQSPESSEGAVFPSVDESSGDKSKPTDNEQLDLFAERES